MRNARAAVGCAAIVARHGRASECAETVRWHTESRRQWGRVSCRCSTTHFTV